MKLIRLGNGRYRVTDGKFQIEGTWGMVSTYLLYERDVESQELYAAIEEMTDNGNDTAVFGLSHTFIRSYCGQVSNSTLMELKAIRDVRYEFKAACQTPNNSVEAKAVFDRLVTLLLSFNEEAAIECIESDTELLAA